MGHRVNLFRPSSRVTQRRARVIVTALAEHDDRGGMRIEDPQIKMIEMKLSIFSIFSIRG